MSEANVITLPCCTEDECRPLDAALQEEASNHLEVLWSRATVLSVQEKAGVYRSGKLFRGEVHEPHMRRREILNAVKSEVLSLSREECGGNLFTAHMAVGVDVARMESKASVWNMGIVEAWRRALRRRSQTAARGTTWAIMRRLAERFVPRPKILRPYPNQRFVVNT
ncbi:MAG: hypothetical protein HQL31_04910 [Planctomycetes bacterium]|nr:hypothetical protein [Planctomycetota bacterium]